MMERDKVNKVTRSSGFRKSYGIGEFSKAFSTEHEVIFPDETNLTGALSAFSTVLSVFSWVSSPEKVRHFCG